MEPGRPSFAASDTTYHSFNDVELIEPPLSPPSTSNGKPLPHFTSEGKADQSAPIVKMQRQDSGYESHNASPRNSTSYTRSQPARRTSLISNNAASSGSLLRSRTRPSTHRSSASQTSVSYQLRPTPPSQAAYFQFPSPDLVELTETGQEPSAPLPPQTTHYWTSDSTRRLEYAAIDAASRGVKGWLRRNLLPDCFVGKERHVAFDDDTGSVRRYRLELEDEQDEKFGSVNVTTTARPRRKSRFFFWTLRKNATF